ncbi:MAG: Zn-ribbon domain-containing OB-fold protein [Candidatus Geothermincolia bacterium]
MGEYLNETTSIPGSWPLAQWQWKSEQVPLVRVFLEHLKEKKLMGLKCTECGRVYLPPKAYCICLGTPAEWVEVSDTGVITTYTFTGAWGYEGMVEGVESKVIAGIILDGSDTQTVSILEGANPKEIEVGKRVRIIWPDEPKGILEDLMHWEVIE